MLSNYEQVKLVITYFQAEDIVTASGEGSEADFNEWHSDLSVFSTGGTD